MIKCAVFDLDGTLLDTLGDLSAAVNFSLRFLGRREHSEEEVRGMIGDGVRKLIERALPPEDAALTNEALALFKQYYESHICVNTRPYPGIKELLRALRSEGIKTAVLTNKHERAARLLTDEFFPSLFDAVRGGREGVRLKPFPDALCALLSELDVPCKRAVMIGDSAGDILTAKAAGAHGAGAAWGYRSPAELKEAGAEFIAENADELKEYLLGSGKIFS